MRGAGGASKSPNQSISCWLADHLRTWEPELPSCENHFFHSWCLTLTQIFCEHDTTSTITAECILAVGVKLSRMTEPGDRAEWYVLPDKTRQQLEKRRNAWDAISNYVPKVFADRPKRTRKSREPICLPRPLVDWPVSDASAFIFLWITPTLMPFV